MKKVYVYSSILFLIDLISKQLVLNFVNKPITIINNFFKIVKTSNEGAAFSILIGYKTVFIILAIVIIVYMCKYLMKDISTKLEIISYSLLLGGILGNLFDRIFYGKVIDFISINLFGYMFPVFNLADSFIVMGAIILTINLIKGDKNVIRSKRK